MVTALKTLLVSIFLVVLTGCEGALKVDALKKQRAIVSSLSLTEVQEGDIVTVHGALFTERLTLTVNETEVPLTIVDATEASFEMPAFSDTSIQYASFEDASLTVAKFALINKNRTDSQGTPLVASSLCTDVILPGADGNIVRGTRICDAQRKPCSDDGEEGCITNSDFPAVKKSILGSALVAGRTIANIAGTVSPKPDDCNSDAQIDCVAVPAFPAVDASAALATNIRTGITLAGIAGTLDPAAASCSADGESHCITSGNFVAIDKINTLSSNASHFRSSLNLAGITGSLNDCANDGATGCFVAGPSYVALASAGAASKIVSGQTLAGISGTGALRPSDCSGDGQTNCVAVASYPSVTKATITANTAKISSSLTLASVSGTLPDCSSDGAVGCIVVGPSYAAALTTGAGGKILAGQTLGGISGSAPIKPANCSVDGDIDCVAVSGFAAADASTSANKIVAGQSVGGITGAATGVRPSDCSADAELGCVSISGFPAMKVAGAAAKIAAGDSLGGVLGIASARPSDCSTEGQTSCVAVSAYPALDKSSLSSNAAKIHSSLTVAGITGTLSDCSSDGAVSCVAVAGFPAATVAGSAAKIISGQSVAGISGSAPVKPNDCDSDGATECVAVTNYPSVDISALTTNAPKIRSSLTIASVSGTLADCASDGGTNCVAVTGFPSANTASASSKILTGQTLAGIPGSAALKPADCSSDGGTGCVAVADYPAFDKVRLTANTGKMRTSLSVGTVSGTLADCSTDNDMNCVAIATHPSVIASNVNPGIIKSGSVVAGVTGNYPSSTYPLAVSDGYADLDTSTFNAKIKSASNFGWFDRTGARYSAAGDADITAASIKNGVVIFGTTGTFGADCTGDGQMGCLTTALFPAANTASFTTWDVRSGKTIGGISGSLQFSASGALLTRYNRTSGTGADSSSSAADLYDTIDDFNADSAFPVMAASPLPIAVAALWTRDSLSDSNSNGICDGSEACVYKDNVTNLYWSKASSTSMNWEDAITYCETLSYGGRTGWRLPTQKEWKQAYIDGINFSRVKRGLTNLNYWTATTNAQLTSSAYGAWLDGNDASSDKVSASLPVVCAM